MYVHCCMFYFLEEAKPVGEVVENFFMHILCSSCTSCAYSREIRPSWRQNYPSHGSIGCPSRRCRYQGGTGCSCGDGRCKDAARTNEGSLRPASVGPEIDGFVKRRFVIALAHIDGQFVGSARSLQLLLSTRWLWS